MEPLTVTSPDFEEGGWIPRRNSPRGENRSPALRLVGLVPGARSVAVTLDDASHPIFPNFNHWLIWNLPPEPLIPGGIPAGEAVDSLGGAMQGRAYGRNRYKGPKPPLRWIHTYVFTVYALDCRLNLSPTCRKPDLLAAMEGHILQRAALSGQFQSGRP